jgi:hypothetical protein
MTGNELDILCKFVVVYDKARCHFLFEIVEDKVTRHLNAETIRTNAIGPKPLKYLDFKELLLERCVNSVQTEDLLSYILKSRDEGCPVRLWVAERMSEMKLLMDDGIKMNDKTWLVFTLAFVTAEERLALRVPAESDREAYKGKGYSVEDLDKATGEIDARTLKRFRQNACSDPVATRVFQLDKLVKRDKGEKAANKPHSVERKELDHAFRKKDTCSEKTVRFAELQKKENESEDSAPASYKGLVA